MYILKKSIFTVLFFDGTLTENLYPDRCKKDSSSPTGYSYGDGVYSGFSTDQKTGFQERNSVAIPEKCCIVLQCNGKIEEILSQDDFSNKYCPMVG